MGHGRKGPRDLAGLLPRGERCRHRPRKFERQCHLMIEHDGNNIGFNSHMPAAIQRRRGIATVSGRMSA
jgi:hypothetical protein